MKIQMPGCSKVGNGKTEVLEQYVLEGLGRKFCLGKSCMHDQVNGEGSRCF